MVDPIKRGSGQRVACAAALIVLLLITSGCASSSGEAGSDLLDVAGSVDADADNDLDGDADPDSGADLLDVAGSIDADADSETEVDGEPDADVDMDADTGAEGDVDLLDVAGSVDADVDSDADADTEVDTEMDADEDVDATGPCADGPLDEPIPGCAPAPPPSSGDIYQDCVDRINQLRWECQCLPPLQRWTAVESCADEQAEHDVNNGPYAGFTSSICSPKALAQNGCPGWGSVTQVLDGCLQMQWNQGPPPQEPCTGQCIQEHALYLNMTNASYSRVGCGFHTTQGGAVWAVQDFQ